MAADLRSRMHSLGASASETDGLLPWLLRVSKDIEAERRARELEATGTIVRRIRHRLPETLDAVVPCALRLERFACLAPKDAVQCAVFDPELCRLPPSELVRRLLVLRTLLPGGLDLPALVSSEPGVLLLGAESPDPESLQIVVSAALAELRFLPPPVLRVVLQDEPQLLMAGWLRLEHLREAWQQCALCAVSEEELEKQSTHARFEQYIRNTLINYG